MAVPINLDFKKVAEQDKPVPTSAYPVLVKAFKLTAPKEGTAPPSVGSPNEQGKYHYFAVRVEITDGPYAGKALFCNLTTDPSETTNGSQKNFMLFRFLRVFGMVTEDGQANIDINLIVNQPMTWQVEEKTDGTNDVKSFAKAA